MKITREVVKDLMAVYMAGDASADTRALVEDWLRTDPELASQLDRARRLDLPKVAAPPPTAEKRSLDRTRRYLIGRTVVLGMAVYFSSLPLTVTFGSNGFHGFLLHDWSARFPVIIVAAALWIAYWRMSRRLTTGSKS
jgi:hypothetical protein